MDYAGRSMKAQMKQANKFNAKRAVIIGDDELARGVAVVRNMEDSQQEQVKLSELLTVLAKG